MHQPQEPSELALKDVLPRPLDFKAIMILIVTALVLTGSHYFGSFPRVWHQVVWLLEQFGVDDARMRVRAIFEAPERGKLWQLCYWAGAHTLLYLVIPAVVVKLLFRERLRDYGLKITGWHKKLWIYAGAFAVVLPLVLLFGKTTSFQSKYPFYRNAGASWADFLGWECAYGIQFFALEFFFRGFLVHGLKQRFGYYCVFVMTVPYCMIHFGKPLPETIGAIIAGVFLGTLSLWTRSIWLGFLIHVSVALSMDLVALGYRGELKALLGS